MKHIFSFSIIATLLALSMTSCIIHIKPASNDYVEETFDFKDFNTIDNLAYADVVYIPGNHYSVKVKATEHEMNDLVLSLENNHLVISSPTVALRTKDTAGVEGVKHETWYFSTGARDLKPITIYVTCPKLSLVNIAGSGTFTCKKDLHADDLALDISGSGNINLGRTYAHNVTVSVKGSGDVKIDWISANSIRYGIEGSGSINSKEFHTNNSIAQTTGSGDISIDYIDCVNSEAVTAGSGDIFLSGTVESSKRTTVGIGKIHIESLKTKYAPQTKDE